MTDTLDIQHVDELKMYFREPYVINKNIVLYQPTIGDIIEFGEAEYYGMITTLCAIPSDMKSKLWDDYDVDYTTISDFYLFCFLTRQLTKEQTRLVLGELDLSKLIVATRDDEEIILCNEHGETIIDNYIYLRIVDYLRKVHNLKPKIEMPANEFTKKVLIDDDRQRKQMAANKGFHSNLQPLISSLVNSAGFKYKLQELKEVGYVEFMDSVQRIQIIKQTEALLSGMYSGMVDTSKMDKKNLNWLRKFDE